MLDYNDPIEETQDAFNEANTTPTINTKGK